jgi:hypothetical protein
MEFDESLRFQVEQPPEVWRVGRACNRLKIRVMPQQPIVRNLIFAGLGLVAGFFALAVAVPLEAQLLPWAIALFSPGLKLAELIMPETHGSMAWTFGWFLRIAIAANTVFYYGVFALLAYAFTRRAAK